MNTTEMLALLNPLRHIRCHRNHIVHPAAMQWLGSREIALPQGMAIPVSPLRVRPLRKGQALRTPINPPTMQQPITQAINIINTHKQLTISTNHNKHTSQLAHSHSV